MRRGAGLSRLRETTEAVSLVVGSAMGSLRKALIAVAIVGAWAGVGSTLFVLVTPGKEQVQAMLKVRAIGNPRWDGWASGESLGLEAETANLSS